MGSNFYWWTRFWLLSSRATLPSGARGKQRQVSQSELNNTTQHKIFLSLWDAYTSGEYQTSILTRLIGVFDSDLISRANHSHSWIFFVQKSNPLHCLKIVWWRLTNAVIDGRIERFVIRDNYQRNQRSEILLVHPILIHSIKIQWLKSRWSSSVFINRFGLSRQRSSDTLTQWESLVTVCYWKVDF